MSQSPEQTGSEPHPGASSSHLASSVETQGWKWHMLFPVTQNGNYSWGLSPGSITVCGVWCLLRLVFTTFHNSLPKERGSPCFWATGLQGLWSPRELPCCPQGRTEPSFSARLQVARVRSACSAPLQNWHPQSLLHIPRWQVEDQIPQTKIRTWVCSKDSFHGWIYLFECSYCRIKMNSTRGLMNHFNWKAHKSVQTGLLGHINDVKRSLLLNSWGSEVLGPRVEVERWKGWLWAEVPCFEQILPN